MANTDVDRIGGVGQGQKVLTSKGLRTMAMANTDV